MSKPSSRILVNNNTFKRIYEVTECNTQEELANFLGLRQSTISYAQSQKSISSDWLMAILSKKNINPFWILGKDVLKYLYPSESEEIYCNSLINIHKTLHDFTYEELMHELASRLGNNVTISLTYKP